MIQEYAVEPTIFSTYERYCRWSSVFGAENGRVISEYPKTWKKKAYEAMEETSVMNKKRLALRIEKLRENRILAKFNRTEFTEELTWLENACRQHSSKPFQAVISNCNPANLTGVIQVNDIDDETEEINVERSSFRERTGYALAAHLQNLLASAYEIKVIDPYFRPGDPVFTNTLAHIMRAAKNGVELKKVEVHLSAKHSKSPTVDFFVDECRHNLKKVLPPVCPVHLYRWCDISQSSAKLHNRYIITQLSGVNLAEGTAEEPGKLGLLTLLTEAVRAKLWSDYSENSTSFERECGPITIF